MSGGVNDILETCLYVSDLEIAERFYSQVLGLTLYSKVAGRHLFFRCGSRMLLLFNPAASSLKGDVPSHGATGPGHVAFAIGEDEIEPWKARLAAHKVVVELEYAWPGGGR